MTSKPNSLLKFAILILYVAIFIFGLLVLAGLGVFPTNKVGNLDRNPTEITTDSTKIDTLYQNLWSAPAPWRLDINKNKELINYGQELIVHTAKYLGPQGTVKQMSNGMNCQNCHLEAGTRPWGNNYFGVSANFPKFRARSGKIEDIQKRVNDCFERSLNGSTLDTNSREMKAIVAYLHFLGQDVKKNTTPKGTGIFKIKSLNRAADSEKGKIAYQQKCSSCHQLNGEGLKNGSEYTYPPLWGTHSYNNGAGLFRMSNFAGYIKQNMPFGVKTDNPTLSDEECWDIAAYVNSMPRPIKDLSKDWPDISKKPFDHPFGPYIDPFSEAQHKYGPFKQIKNWYKKNNTK